jgi:hypothetical protein
MSKHDRKNETIVIDNGTQVETEILETQETQTQEGQEGQTQELSKIDKVYQRLADVLTKNDKTLVRFKDEDATEADVTRVVKELKDISYDYRDKAWWESSAVKKDSEFNLQKQLDCIEAIKTIRKNNLQEAFGLSDFMIAVIIFWHDMNMRNALLEKFRILSCREPLDGFDYKDWFENHCISESTVLMSFQTTASMVRYPKSFYGRRKKNKFKNGKIDDELQLVPIRGVNHYVYKKFALLLMQPEFQNSLTKAEQVDLILRHEAEYGLQKTVEESILNFDDLEEPEEGQK